MHMVVPGGHLVLLYLYVGKCLLYVKWVTWDKPGEKMSITLHKSEKRNIIVFKSFLF